jgi:hypothetical protein
MHFMVVLIRTQSGGYDMTEQKKDTSQAESLEDQVKSEDLLDDEMEVILQEDALPVGPGY